MAAASVQFTEQLVIGRTLLVFAYLAMLGVLQIVGTRNRRPDLSPLARSPRAGYALGGLLIASAYAWFFGTQPNAYLSPGPASFEFAVILLMGLGGANLTTRLVARLLGGRSTPAP
ncbi:MAG: hypothetical protein ACE5NC_13300 [Anaerolineae bacterium]